MKRTLMLLFIVMWVLKVVASAQDSGSPIEGTDSFQYQTDDEGRGCYIYNKYVFIALPTESNGFHFSVYQRADGSSNTESPQNVCRNGRRTPYMVIKNTDEQFFSGVVGDKVLIDSGTGPDSRELIIINLKSKRTIYSDEVNEVDKVTDSRFLTYTEFSNARRPLKECPKAKEWRRSDLSVGWVQRTNLDLQTLKKSKVGKVSCTALQ